MKLKKLKKIHRKIEEECKKTECWLKERQKYLRNLKQEIKMREKARDRKH